MIVGVNFVLIALTMIYMAVRYHGLPFCRCLLWYGGFMAIRSSVLALASLDALCPYFSIVNVLIPFRILTAGVSLVFVCLAPKLLNRVVWATKELQRNADINLRLERMAHVEAEAKHFHNITDLMPDIMWTASADGSIDWYNKRWYDYTGLTAGQTLGWGWVPVIHADDITRTRKDWTESIRLGINYNTEYRFRRCDGEYRWHMGRAFPVRDTEGEVQRWVGECIDIHDLKREDFLQRNPEYARLQSIGVGDGK